ncbi:hypothetical protein F3Y22_tig00008386pilonHSYRG00082 [Hibiscus syriacus]|uniref:NAC domain-containing protein n=1 Tax=Hibiscus syriacus TaxID=106335 RepID=A0A6A3CDT7_HIBSY|nr:hypothetical protein F3Y22_tig00008386pilonHSYRG00082 [Hibiscus syriacus]
MNDQTTNKDNGHWVMHEFSLKRKDLNVRVICEIKNRDAKKSNDEEISSIPDISNSDDDSNSQIRDRYAMDLDLNLHPKPNDEEKPNNGSKDDVWKIQNNNDVDSYDEETGLIPQLSLNREDSNDDGDISYKQRNKDVACQILNQRVFLPIRTQPKIIVMHITHPQNPKRIEDTSSPHLERQESSITNDSPWQILRKFIDEADEVHHEILLKELDWTSKDLVDAVGMDAVGMDADVSAIESEVAEIVVHSSLVHHSA